MGTGIIGYILFLLFIISIYRIQIKYEKVTYKDKLILATIIISFFNIITNLSFSVCNDEQNIYYIFNYTNNQQL